MFGWPQQNKIGDYYDMVSDNLGADVAYSATFNGEEDVYYLRIPHVQVGDLNCDGSLNGLDIDAFVLAVTGTPPDYPEYVAQYPDCDVTLADCNADGSLNGLDIDPFVDLLTGS